MNWSFLLCDTLSLHRHVCVDFAQEFLPLKIAAALPSRVIGHLRHHMRRRAVVVARKLRTLVLNLNVCVVFALLLAVNRYQSL